MRLRAIVVAACLAAPLSTLPATTPATAASDRLVTITGTGVDAEHQWPAYAPGIERFAVPTTAEADGEVLVSVTSSDPEATVRVNGRASTGPTTVSGLQGGDEVNVQIDANGVSTNQSFVYLPSAFPAMTATSAGTGPSPGYVFLTTTSLFPATRFETVVDRNGVPVYIHEHLNPMDLKLQPNGHYSVARGLTNQLDSSFDIVELNSRFEPIASYTNPAPLQNTEFHDSVLLPDGGRILMAYEHAEPPSSDIDSVVQEVNPDGSLGLTWNSADHTVPADRLAGLDDYAHLNSIEVMQDDDLLLSFRHLSQVMKVDRDTGDVVWRLGGTRSDFTFPDDPYGGPCAQHTARELANGDIQIWDNGSRVGQFTLHPLCPDGPDAGTSGPDERAFSRVVTYHLESLPANGNPGVARMVQEFKPAGGDSFSEFAGSAQRLGAGTLDDNVLLGMADAHQPGGAQVERPDVLEVTKDGQVVWTLDIPGIFSYRAAKYPAPDATPPTIELSGIDDGATLSEDQPAPTLAYTCTDRGGSNLASCSGTVASGGPVPMTPGPHTLTVTASDRDGNTQESTVSYSVTETATAAPDARIRKPGGPWVGSGRIGSADQQTVRMRLGERATGRVTTVRVRVKNVGNAADRVRVAAGVGNAAFGVRYRFAGKDLTAQVKRGWLTPRLVPGEMLTLSLRVTRRPAAGPGDRRKVTVTVTARHAPEARDKVALLLEAG